MGIDDSPLHGRVIFVLGSPRSGTSWVQRLLATHPQVAGVGSESHLFDLGVDRLFDNHEGPESYLAGFVSRSQLVDLARDLCDGVLQAMRAQVKPEAAFVAEKTPVGDDRAQRHVARKLECYPDAWYVHVVRDPGAVTRSLRRAEWRSDRSARGAGRTWRQSVEAVRSGLREHPRYREVGYEDLRDDLEASVGELFGWLGLGLEGDVLARARTASGVRDSNQPPGSTWGPPCRELVGDIRSAVVRMREAARQLRRWGAQLPSISAAPGGDGLPEPAAAFLEALREGDSARLEAATTPGFSLELRSPQGDAVASGDRARALLAGVGEQMFARPFASEAWMAAGGRIPMVGVVFAGLTPEARRVDASFHLLPESGRVARLILLLSGPPDGRPVTAWPDR